jgi:hypothetical protein
VGKFAKFLISQGHEVRVLAANDPPVLPGLPVEIDKDLITYTPWLNVNFIPELFFGGRKNITTQGYSTQTSGIKKLGQLYRFLVNFPDEQIGWLPLALRVGRKIIDEWRPNLIYASGLPATTLIIGSRLSQLTKIPWIAELRDLWIEEERYYYPKWRLNIERRLERSVLSRANAMVTVSEPWAQILQKQYNKTVVVASNGYDPADYPSKENLHITASDKLQIVYTGTYYPAFQDVKPLFLAMQNLGPEAENIRFVCYSRYTQPILSAANEYGVAHLVSVFSRIDYLQSIRVQSEADILLLFLWGDPKNPKEDGMLPAKMFEYLGSLRPILALGLGQDTASQIIRERKAGLISNDPSEIAQQLKNWIDQKAKSGVIQALPPDVRNGFSREEQYEKILTLLLTIKKG